mmetsp:Transcript_15222/g.43547  ORF Transcript_15222/g.43547 Transcript_15222/m.43547 type:complete len:357 (-) Transcript_15222:1104-2174(-)
MPFQPCRVAEWSFLLARRTTRTSRTVRSARKQGRQTSLAAFELGLLTTCSTRSRQGQCTRGRTRCCAASWRPGGGSRASRSWAPPPRPCRAPARPRGRGWSRSWCAMATTIPVSTSTTTLLQHYSMTSSVSRHVVAVLAPGPMRSGSWAWGRSSPRTSRAASRARPRRCFVLALSAWACTGQCPMKTSRCSLRQFCGSPSTAGASWRPTPSTARPASGCTAWTRPSAGASGSRASAPVLQLRTMRPVPHQRGPSLSWRVLWESALVEHGPHRGRTRYWQLRTTPFARPTAVHRWPCLLQSGQGSTPPLRGSCGLLSLPMWPSHCDPRSLDGLSWQAVTEVSSLQLRGRTPGQCIPC